MEEQAQKQKTQRELAIEKLIKPGRYRAKVIYCAAVNPENPKISIVFEIAGLNQQIDGDLYLTPKTWQKTVDTLRDLGWKSDDVKDLPAHVQGAQCSIVIKHENIEIDQQIQYFEDGSMKVRARVQWINAAPRALAGAELESLSERIRRLMGGGTASQSTPQQPPQQTPTESPPPDATGDDDDIPF
jgi:hypothetical protein